MVRHTILCQSRPMQPITLLAPACLQHGLKLDLNRLARQGLVKLGAQTGPFVIRWTNTYWQEEIASGLISANLQGSSQGWLRIQISTLDQWINLSAMPRHFGGRQWYCECPKTGCLSSVLWMPLGASRFASRHAWPRRVAYSSQFMTAR